MNKATATIKREKRGEAEVKEKKTENDKTTNRATPKRLGYNNKQDK